MPGYFRHATWILITACIGITSVQAHKLSDSYLSLQIEKNKVLGRWDVALVDLDQAVGLDIDKDRKITWGEVKSRRAEVAHYSFSRLHLRTESGPCKLQLIDYRIDSHTDGPYAVMRFSCPLSGIPKQLRVDYRFLFDLDPLHRGLLKIESPGKGFSAVFSPSRKSRIFDLEAGPAYSASVFGFGREGVWHIWKGYDHILFLLALLLPSVLLPNRKIEGPETSFASIIFNVLRIVTAFTAAHSITLALAVLNLVNLPSRGVESVIAASVLIAAGSNLFPAFSRHGWVLAFVFGLVHGFGFASVLAGLGPASGNLLRALFGFNLGVEIGQMVIVCLFIPFAYALKNTPLYRALILPGGSLLIATIAFLWMVERMFALEFMPL